MQPDDDAQVPPLFIRSIASRLSPAARSVRRRILAQTLETGKPFNIRTYDGPPIAEEIDELLTQKAMAADDRGNIPFIYPVSALPTHHQVTLADGRRFSAMCAIDALGAAFAFAQDTEIRSQCSVCEATVQLRLRDGRIDRATPPEGYALHMDLNQMDDWAATC